MLKILNGHPKKMFLNTVLALEGDYKFNGRQRKEWRNLGVNRWMKKKIKKNLGINLEKRTHGQPFR